MKERFIVLIIYLVLAIVIVLGFLFWVYMVIGGLLSPSLEDKIFGIGLGISIGGSLLLWPLLKLGEKIKFLNNFLKKPSIEKIIRGLLKLFIFIWVSIVLWGFLKYLFAY